MWLFIGLLVFLVGLFGFGLLLLLLLFRLLWLLLLRRRDAIVFGDPFHPLVVEDMPGNGCQLVSRESGREYPLVEVGVDQRLLAVFRFKNLAELEGDLGWGAFKDGIAEGEDGRILAAS